MKHLKLFENYLTNINTLEDAENFDIPEVFKLREILKKLVEKNLSLEYTKPTNNINLEVHDNKKHKSYSITLEIYQHYFVFQFDYKEDGIHIKYLNSCEGGLKKDISKFKILFDATSKENNDGIWVFDKEELMKGLDNYDLYIQTNKYNI